ncbi:MAG: helix-hairpin-helix domain-containing protein [Melioribacteraceae bacterium]|nr:helix-hairpin-helix domain-containing protein [Melioribacteraceae bacterium]
MKKIIENISLKTGLTKIEIKTSAFVILFFIIGIIAKQYKLKFEIEDKKEFNYSFQDSLFKALSQSKSDIMLKKKEKRVDSEVELSDFSNKEKEPKQKGKVKIDANSININTASVETLKKIPGIGEVIANNIILLRQKKGKFSSLDELIEVKRIGSKKLSSIKKYLYLEK